MLIIIDKVISLEEWQVLLSQQANILLKADGIYNLSLKSLSKSMETITNLKLYVLREDLQARQLVPATTLPLALVSLAESIDLSLNHFPLFHYRKFFVV